MFSLSECSSSLRFALEISLITDLALFFLMITYSFSRSIFFFSEFVCVSIVLYAWVLSLLSVVKLDLLSMIVIIILIFKWRTSTL